MPWGPNPTQNPSVPTIMTDPSQVATPGMAQQVQAVQTAAGAGQGKANNAALAALQRAGVAGGSEATNALGNIAGQTAQGEAQGLSGLQSQQFQEQEGLLNSLNQAALGQYGEESQNNLANQELRQQLLGGVGSALGSLGGAALMGGSNLALAKSIANAFGQGS